MGTVHLSAPNTTNALDFQDLGTMSEELLNVPGFVNELKNYTLAVSPRPNPPLAALAPTAMGKKVSST